MSMARAFTKPITTDLETKRMSLASLRYPTIICMMPVKIVAANKY